MANGKKFKNILVMCRVLHCQEILLQVKFFLEGLYLLDARDKNIFFPQDTRFGAFRVEVSPIKKFCFFCKALRNFTEHIKDNAARIRQINLHDKPTPVAERSKAWACGGSVAEVAGSNPAVGLDGCAL